MQKVLLDRKVAVNPIQITELIIVCSNEVINASKLCGQAAIFGLL